MDELLAILNTMNLNAPCKTEELEKIEQYLGKPLPKDYAEFMKLHNGGEGPVGENGYLAIWDTDEVLDVNTNTEYPVPVKDLFYFASDRSGLLYAYDKNNYGKIVEIWDANYYIESDKPKLIATSLKEFAQYIHDIEE